MDDHGSLFGTSRMFVLPTLGSPPPTLGKRSFGCFARHLLTMRWNSAGAWSGEGSSRSTALNTCAVEFSAEHV